MIISYGSALTGDMAKPTPQRMKETLVGSLCKQVTVPKGSNVLRLADGSGRPTAVCQLEAKPPLNWGTPPIAAQQLLPPDEAIVMVSNDPLCAYSFTDKNPTGAVSTQQWVWGINGGTPVQTLTLAPGQQLNLENDLMGSQPSGPAPKFHGNFLYARKFKGRYWVWCDGSTTVGGTRAVNIVTPSGLAAGDALIFTLFRLNEGDPIVVTASRVPGAIGAGVNVAALSLTAADFYALDISADDDNTSPSISVRVENTWDCETVCHRALPDLTERMQEVIAGIRVTGASSHVINLASEQYATGTWVGDQPEGATIWTAYLRGASGGNGFQKLTAQRGNEVMELKKFNPYTWVAPEDTDDWKLSHPFTFDAAGRVSNTLNKDMSKFHYTIVYLKAGGVAVADDPARKVQLDFQFAGEYTSDGQWPMMGTSPLTEDDTAAAVKVLSSMENITHNPAFADIMKTIGKYVRLSAPVLALLGPYGKAASLAATGIGAGLGALGYRTRKTARRVADTEPPDEAEPLEPAPKCLRAEAEGMAC